MENLDDIRKRINAIDSQMVELFEKRMEESRKVLEYKMANSLAISDPAREAEVIRLNSTKVSDDTIREYYINFEQNLMDLSKAYQRRLMSGMKVAYNGDSDTLSLEAAGKLFPQASLQAYDSFESAYDACVKGECDAVVLPLENSSEGDLGSVSDLMFSGSLFLNRVGELELQGGESTRFGAFSRVLNKDLGKEKMGKRFMLMFTVKHEAGSLVKTLNIIGAHNFNMCSLRSRPMKDLMWNYYFCIELEGDVNSADGQSLLKELAAVCDRFKLAGAYRID